MPLFKPKDRKVELPFIFTEHEEILKSIMPEGLIKSANHNTDILDLLAAEEQRCPEWENSVQDCFTALATGDKARLLMAIRPLSIKEQKEVVSQYYFSMSKPRILNPERKKDRAQIEKNSENRKKLEAEAALPKSLKEKIREDLVKAGILCPNFTKIVPSVADDVKEQREITINQARQFKYLQKVLEDEGALDVDIFHLCLIGRAK